MIEFTEKFHTRLALYDNRQFSGNDYWNYWSSPYNTMNPYNYGKGAGVSPLFTAWFNDKSGLNQFCDLVYNKWWTRGAESVTDNNGAAEVSGFYSDYDVTVSAWTEKK